MKAAPVPVAGRGFLKEPANQRSFLCHCFNCDCPAFLSGALFFIQLWSSCGMLVLCGVSRDAREKKQSVLFIFFVVLFVLLFVLSVFLVVLSC
jgi:hypothetical protein